MPIYDGGDVVGLIFVGPADGLRYNPGMTRALPLLLLLLAACAGGAPGATDDPLPSWNDNPRKQAILEFAKAAVATYSPEERVAVFDHDGTLWSEKPVSFQLEFIEDRVRRSRRSIRTGRSGSRSSRSSKGTSPGRWPAGGRRWRSCPPRPKGA